MQEEVNKSVFLAEASEIVGTSATTIQNWIKRGYVTAKKNETIKGGTARGRNFRFNFVALTEIAVANELVKVGITPRRAFEIAVDFAHIGEGGTGWEVGTKDPVRNPSLPFHHSLGETYLCASEDQIEVMLVRKGENPLGKYPIMLDVWPIFSRIVIKLGGRPFELLDSIYGKHHPNSAEASAE